MTRRPPRHYITVDRGPSARPGRAAESHRRLDARADAVGQLGAFGSPTFAWGREIFCGDDRLEVAIDRAKTQSE